MWVLPAPLRDASRGSDLSFKTKKGSIYGDGRAPLDLAKSQEVWQYLRSKGAETGRTDYDKALCDAGQEGMPEIVLYFLQKGGNPNAKFDETLFKFRVIKMGGFNIPDFWTMKCRGITPLHYACFGGSEDVVRLLVKKGSRVNTPDADMRTPLDFALFRGHTNIVTYLRSVGAKEQVGEERMLIQSTLENISPGLHEWRNCSLMPSYDFSKHYSGVKPDKLDDMKGTAIIFEVEWGGWDKEPVSFRNGMIGKCKAGGVYVKEGTEARYSEKHYRFNNGKWVEIKN